MGVDSARWREERDQKNGRSGRNKREKEGGARAHKRRADVGMTALTEMTKGLEDKI